MQSFFAARALKPFITNHDIEPEQAKPSKQFMKKVQKIIALHQVEKIPTQFSTCTPSSDH